MNASRESKLNDHHTIQSKNHYWFSNFKLHNLQVIFNFWLT